MSYEQQLAESIYEILQQYLKPDHAQRLKRVVVRCGQLDKIDEKRLADFWRSTAVGKASVARVPY